MLNTVDTKTFAVARFSSTLYIFAIITIFAIQGIADSRMTTEIIMGSMPDSIFLLRKEKNSMKIKGKSRFLLKEVTYTRIFDRTPFIFINPSKAPIYNIDR